MKVRRQKSQTKWINVNADLGRFKCLLFKGNFKIQSFVHHVYVVILSFFFLIFVLGSILRFPLPFFFLILKIMGHLLNAWMYGLGKQQMNFSLG